MEETELVIKGNNLDSKNNPTAVSVKTSDGDVIALTPTKSNNKRIVVNMPSVSADTKVVLQVSGGNVSATEPEQFVVLLLNKPEGILTLGDDTSSTSLPADASSDIHASTADEVTLASQSNITTLPNLTSVGDGSNSLTIFGTVLFPGPVTANVSGNVSGSASSFTGSLSGDVTGGQSSTSIADTVVTGKTVNGFVAAAGTVDASDTILEALNKLAGNSIQHNGDIASIYSMINSATNSNTANRVVLRDGNGSFAAQDIVAEGKFFGDINGNLIGNVTGNLTGDVTGNVSGTSAGFTGALAGDVTGNQGSTSISATTVTGKALTGFVAGAGTVADTDTILQAFNKVVGNISQHNGNISTISGTLDAATNGNSADTLVLRDGNGDFAVESITANGEFLGSLNGTAARAIAGVQAGSATDLEGGVVTASVTGLNLITLTDSNNATTSEDIDTLTGAVAGQVVTIIFAEAVDVTDNETGAADTINVDSNLGLQFSANDSLQLIYNGTSWYEIGRAHNSN